MSERTPTSAKNLDGYGNPVLDWERVRGPLASGELLRKAAAFGTVRPNGKPHVVRVGAIWMGGDLYFVSGAQSRKAQNIEQNPDCTVFVSLDGMDVSMEGTAALVD